MLIPSRRRTAIFMDSSCSSRSMRKGSYTTKKFSMSWGSMCRQATTNSYRCAKRFKRRASRRCCCRAIPERFICCRRFRRCGRKGILQDCVIRGNVPYRIECDGEAVHPEPVKENVQKFRAKGSVCYRIVATPANDKKRCT